jgi:phage tail-like protein
MAGARSMSSLVAGEFNLRGDSSKFLVEFDDGEYDLGAWSRASGLSVKWDPVEYRRGDYNHVWAAPGIAKYSTISLSRATCPDSQFVQTWLATTSKEPKIFSGSIKLLSWYGLPLCEWRLKQFVPIGWKVADFDSKAATVVIETLDLAHTGFLDDDVELETS